MDVASQRTLRRIPVPIGHLLLFLLAVVQVGCAHVSPARTGQASDGARTTGIVTASFLPEVKLDLPGKGRIDGAVKGAGRGFLVGAEIPLRILGPGMNGCTTKECGYVAIGILAVATASGAVGAVVGGVQGAIEAMPAREARQMERATEGLANLRIQETLAERVLDAGGDSPACRYLLLPGASWSGRDEESDYRANAGQGFDSILEIGAVSVGFKGTQRGSDPPLSVFLKVRVRRYAGADGKLIAVENLVYEGEERKLAEWMADGAAPAEQEFEYGYQDIAERIVATIPCN